MGEIAIRMAKLPCGMGTVAIWTGVVADLTGSAPTGMGEVPIWMATVATWMGKAAIWLAMVAICMATVAIQLAEVAIRMGTVAGAPSRSPLVVPFRRSPLRSGRFLCSDAGTSRERMAPMTAIPAIALEDDDLSPESRGSSPLTTPDLPAREDDLGGISLSDRAFGDASGD